MRVLRFVSGLALFLGLYVGCLWIIGVALSAQDWGLLAKEFGGRRIVAVCWAGGVLCVMAVYLLSSAPRKKPTRFLSFENDDGRISISTDAIRDYIAKLASEFPSVIRMAPNVLASKEGIDIAIDLRVKAGPQIHEVCEVLQKRVRESLANGLGISELRRVEISVKEISSEHRAE